MMGMQSRNQRALTNRWSAVGLNQAIAPATARGNSPRVPA